MKKVWFGLIAIGILFSVINGKPEVLSEVLFYDIQKALDLVLSLIGVMAFWMGLMRIVEKSGLLDKIGKLLSPVVRLLFKDIEHNTKAINATIMCIVANMFGAGNSATALGINAITEMQRENKNKKRATNAMCMLLVIEMSSVQILPMNVIKLRADSGASNPTDIILPTIVATIITTVVAIIAAKIYEKRE